jgi:hypothetical protein
MGKHFPEFRRLTMGYYSEVAVQMKREDYNRMLEELKLKDFQDSYGFCTPDELKEYATKFVASGYNAPEVKEHNYYVSEYVRLYWDSVKWYNSPYINFLESFFLDNEVDFVRLGESSDDAEEHLGLGCYDISTVRYLEFT